MSFLHESELEVLSTSFCTMKVSIEVFMALFYEIDES